MKSLLILGTGGFGQMVRETALLMRVSKMFFDDTDRVKM